NEDRELPLLLLELFERARSDVLRDDSVHGNGLDPERVQELRKELGGCAVRVIDDDLGVRGGDLFSPGDLREERLAVLLSDTLGFEDPADVVVRDPAQVLSEKD